MDGQMNGWWFKTQSQLVSIEHEIRTWWTIITRHTRLLPPSAQIFGLLPSLFCSLLRNACFLSLISPPKYSTFSLGLSPLLTPCLRVVLALFLLPVYIAALALLRISSAGFLKRSACMITTRPDPRRQSWGRETDEEVKGETEARKILRIRGEEVRKVGGQTLTYHLFL